MATIQAPGRGGAWGKDNDDLAVYKLKNGRDGESKKGTQRKIGGPGTCPVYRFAEKSALNENLKGS